MLQLGVLGNRQRFRGQPARPLCAGEEILAPFLASLPFSMTAAQSRALAEITVDLATTQPMSRLLQGDVGSGKTAVAAAALWIAVANGTQGAIMAPTEILAEQHARSFEKMFACLARPGTEEPVRVALLTGRQRKSERDDLLAALAAGRDRHRRRHPCLDPGRGHIPRAERSRGRRATPLRRRAAGGAAPKRNPTAHAGDERDPHPALAGPDYVRRPGCFDDREMPAGRSPIRTKWLTSSQRERAYGFIRRQVAEGRQAFIVYPLVENSEHSEAKAAVDEHARLQNTIFPEYSPGPAARTAQERRKRRRHAGLCRRRPAHPGGNFGGRGGYRRAQRDRDLIEGAERFGLAQLHQFRGRVGRGPHQSYCILVPMLRKATAHGGCRPWRPAMMALRSHRPTWTCAGRATFSAHDRVGCPPCRWPN